MKNYLLVLVSIIFIQCSYDTSNAEKISEEATFINELIAKMSLDEKIGQTSLKGTSSRVKGSLPEVLKEAVRKGEIGSFLNVMNTEYVDELQRIAVEESPNGIPLIFGRDVIHGFKTIFPIPIGIAATWDTQIAKSSSKIAAIEASSVGVRWTFAPMLDITRDSRWGRIAESPGEDPYLASQLATAYIEGFQGEKLSDSTSIVACAKHFLGYGAAIGGRDYNTAVISESLLRNVYLPPFEAAFQAGAGTVMTSFNELNGIPASGNEFILSQILRDELKFDGFVVSDWNSVTEMINHGYAKDEKHAAELAFNSGLDMEMASKSYDTYIKELLQDGKISEQQLDFYVKNILRIKYRLGLFDTPTRQQHSKDVFYQKNHLEEAKKAAIKSSVLLKNNNILPLNKNSKVAIIGPLADQQREQLGTWCFDAEKEKTITPLSAFKTAQENFRFSEGLSYSRDRSSKGFKEAIAIAKTSDVILFFGGEEAILSGEAHSRAHINLPGAQEELLKELAKIGKPIVLILMAGRPLSISTILPDLDAVLMTWHPGTMGGPAIYELLYGLEEPRGRLPISWPKTAGQLPYFYNHKTTGRPANEEDFVQMDDIPIEAWQSSLGNDSHYLDIGYQPQFPFGYGLGYSKFNYKNLSISKDTIGFNENLNINITLKNIGSRVSSEVVQLYIQDVVGSITRPVKELKRFQHVELKPNEERVINFKISSKDLKFINHKLINTAEEGGFNLWVGSHSDTGLKASFYLKN